MLRVAVRQAPHCIRAEFGQTHPRGVTYSALTYLVLLSRNATIITTLVYTYRRSPVHDVVVSSLFHPRGSQCVISSNVLFFS